MHFLLIASFPESIVGFRGPLIADLLASGMSVSVAAPGLEQDSAVRRQLEELGASAIGVPLQRTGMNPVRDLWLLLSLVRLVRRIRPDVVLSYTAKPVIYGSLAAWLCRVPRRFALITGLGYAFTGDTPGRLSGIVSMLYSMSLATVSKVIFQNRDDEALLRHRKVLGKKTKTAVVSGSGVDIREFAVRPVPAGELSFLMIARLLGNKGVREYAEAARIVRARNPRVRFGLVGWIDDNPDSISREELNAWQQSRVIDYQGRLDDVRSAIEHCHVYVLPSYREGTPRTVLEAMSMGRAVITTDTAGCRETVCDGANGYLVPVKSASGLADAMQRFVDSPENIATMGLQSRRIVEERFDVRKVNEAMLREMGIR